MKKYLTILILFIALGIQSCGDILDQTPLDQYSDATVWANVDLASLYLNYCYYELGHGFQSVKMSNFTDESPTGRIDGNTYFTNGMMAADVANLYSSNGHYSTQYTWVRFNTVQRLNIFLEHVDQIPDSYSAAEQPAIQAKADILKGEALFLRAYVYTNMARTYGGLPLLSTANKLNDDFSTITRATLEETVDFIVDDCEAALALLPYKADQELGRACKEAALALKSRILLFAASDLCAGDVSGLDRVGRAYDDPLVHYQSPNRTALWTAARDAAKAVMDLNTLSLATFGAETGDVQTVAKNYRTFFGAETPEGSEWIFTKMFDAAVGTRHRTNQVDGPNGYNNNYGRNGPWELFVQRYEMLDGSKFLDHFETVRRNDTVFLQAKAGYRYENPYIGREPRFYANVLFDSATYDYESRAVGGYNGIYDRRQHVRIAADGTRTSEYGLDTRQTPYTNYQNNGSAVGYLTAKYYQTGVVGSTGYNTNQWPYMRYTEVVLNYAEACIELGTAADLAAATAIINTIRNRVMLPNTTATTQEELRQALRQERAIELYCEDSRIFDLRRWLAIDEYMITSEDRMESTPGMAITETIDYRTTPPTLKMERYYSVVQQPFNMKDNCYWWPIYLEEIKKAPQLQQNPGYLDEEF